MIATPSSVSSEVRIWLIVCCRLWRQVVDVVGDPAEQVAAGLAVDVAERQMVELALDRLAQREHRALHHTGEHVGLRVRQDPRRQVDRRDDEQLAVQCSEVDALGLLERRRR